MSTRRLPIQPRAWVSENSRSARERRPIRCLAGGGVAMDVDRIFGPSLGHPVGWAAEEVNRHVPGKNDVEGEGSYSTARRVRTPHNRGWIEALESIRVRDSVLMYSTREPSLISWGWWRPCRLTVAAERWKASIHRLASFLDMRTDVIRIAQECRQ